MQICTFGNTIKNIKPRLKIALPTKMTYKVLLVRLFYTFFSYHVHPVQFRALKFPCVDDTAKIQIFKKLSEWSEMAVIKSIDIIYPLYASACVHCTNLHSKYLSKWKKGGKNCEKKETKDRLSVLIINSSIKGTQANREYRPTNFFVIITEPRTAQHGIHAYANAMERDQINCFRPRGPVCYAELWNFVKKLPPGAYFHWLPFIPSWNDVLSLLLSKVNAAAILLLCVHPVHPRVRQTGVCKLAYTRKQPEPFNYEAELLGFAAVSCGLFVPIFFLFPLCASFHPFPVPRTRVMHTYYVRIIKSGWKFEHVPSCAKYMNFLTSVSLILTVIFLLRLFYYILSLSLWFSLYLLNSVAKKYGKINIVYEFVFCCCLLHRCFVSYRYYENLDFKLD